MLNLSVIVPVRNAAHLIDECLASIVRAAPCEIIVVDGLSTDDTLAIAKRYPVRILSDQGQGIAAARSIGIRAARCPYVALIDADVVLPDGSLAQLFEEYRSGGYAALQSALLSVTGPGYWGRALVQHHTSGRLKNWFGLGATIFRRDLILEHDFDERFLSGEDIELRWRLRRARARIGVSQYTVMLHRFDDTFAFARSQWLADGQGLGCMVRKYGWHAFGLIVMPIAAAVRGSALALLRLQPTWLPYYVCYAFFNYVGIITAFRASLRLVRSNVELTHDKYLDPVTDVELNNFADDYCGIRNP